MAEGDTTGDAAQADPGGAVSAVKTFLIADVRGYTTFTQEHGDEAAARLAGAFAQAARAGVSLRDGEVIELRGDEALAVFGSARQALRAAVELQQRFAELAAADAGLPLRVGIGLDVGEAVPLERGYRGAALNRAARLCAKAGPGEVFATDSVIHLAGKTEGLEYRDGGRLSLKGLTEPIRVHRVVAAGTPQDSGKRKGFTHAAPGSHRRAWWLAAGGGGAAAAVAVTLVLVLGSGPSSSAPTQIGANSAGAIDTGSNKLVAQVHVGSGPGRVASGAGSLWVANEFANSVSRVDPATSFVEQTIDVDLDPTALAFGDGALWVACSGTAKLLWINPETYKIVKRISVGNGPSAVALSPGAVWVTNRFDDTVTEIDPTSGRVERTLEAGPNPSDITYGFGALWISNESASTVTRLDPRTGATEAVLVGNGPDAVAAGAGSIWAANGLDGTVSRIDPATGVEVSVIPVGLGPSSMVVDRSAVWVADSYSGTVSRIDAGANRVVRSIPVGNAPESLASADGRVWLSARAAAATHRGGTLRVVMSADLVGSLDTSGGEDDLTAMLGDGLVGFKRVSGLDGGTLVPDLATSLPAPTDGGLTYTFQLRSGIRYSNGEPVRASDLRRALERAFLIDSPGAFYYSGLVGGNRCSKSHCDLARGVVANDATGTVTLHLTTPDPEFEYKLALAYARLLPKVPMKPLDRLGVPGTGPHMVASHGPKQIVFVRNPYFHEWSAAAQPDGYPDRIVWNLTGSPDQQLTDVEQGKDDLDNLTELGWRDELATRYTAQVHVFPDPTTYGLFLNTRLAPFDNVLVRRALNYAIDRRKVLVAFGGTEGASVTCQILPVGTPGYEPYCPYTEKPGDVWTAPDFALARKLVAGSGTSGEKIVLWVATHPRPLAVARAAAKALEELGYPRLAEVVLRSDHLLLRDLQAEQPRPGRFRRLGQRVSGGLAVPGHLHVPRSGSSERERFAALRPRTRQGDRPGVGCADRGHAARELELGARRSPSRRTRSLGAARQCPRGRGRLASGAERAVQPRVGNAPRPDLGQIAPESAGFSREAAFRRRRGSCPHTGRRRWRRAGRRRPADRDLRWSARRLPQRRSPRGT